MPHRANGNGVLMATSLHNYREGRPFAGKLQVSLIPHVDSRLLVRKSPVARRIPVREREGETATSSTSTLLPED
jgi:hypothetical protein